MDSHPSTPHFEEKDAQGHLVEKQAKALLDRAESHGNEMSGHLTAGADALRDGALLGGLLAMILAACHLPLATELLLWGIAMASWSLWKAGRSGWIAQARLERLHRIIQEEKWEIEHHRSQEREELEVIYRAKGFEGELLEQVVDVLMADSNRLLRIMVEEELGLTLESQEHPLKQATAAGLSAVVASLVLFLTLVGGGTMAAVAMAIVLVAVAACISAYYEHNQPLAALVWNVGLAILPLSSVYFLLSFFALS